MSGKRRGSDLLHSWSGACAGAVAEGRGWVAASLACVLEASAVVEKSRGMWDSELQDSRCREEGVSKRGRGTVGARRGS